MSGLRCTLLGDGSSDKLLESPIRWALRRENVRIETFDHADLSRVSPKPANLKDRVVAALVLYPCDLLFVHRDAESASHAEREREILSALSPSTKSVPLVPVRMTEAWFLHDESAIRFASGNPGGKMALALPNPSRVEREINPKQVLFDALLVATGGLGRHRGRKKKKLPQMRAQTVGRIEDYSALMVVPSFAKFIDALQYQLSALGQL